MSKKGMTPAKAEEVRKRMGYGEDSKIKQMRIKKGLSQSELAAVAGLPAGTIRRYEQEKGKIDRATFSNICRICNALNCKITDILEDDKLISRYNKIK